jgi:CubicO group peptidase (beta-lactamase class C family)
MNTSDQKASKPDTDAPSRSEAQAAPANAGPPFAVPGFRLSDPSIALPQWKRAAEIDRVVDEAISNRHIVGAVIVAARDGQVIYQRAAGYADRESRRAVHVNEVFRLASMTKAIVSAAVLALMDRGEIDLDDPVTRWLPEFRPRLADGRQPVITVRHLLTHTAGLGYGFLEPSDGPYHRLGVSDGMDASNLTLAENLTRIAAAPLLFEPGSSWHYSVAADVLGAVLERATGKALPAVVRNIVIEPLGMNSLDFVASESAVLATPYGDATPKPRAMTSSFELPFFGGAIRYSPARVFDGGAYPSGGTGMVGTARDYLRFIEAIRTGGAGIVRPATAAAMTRNAIGDLSSAPGFGWGLGVQVLKDPAAAQSPLNAGAWNWGGVYGTHFWVDPTAALSFVVLTNTAIAGMIGAFPSALQRAVYST